MDEGRDKHKIDGCRLKKQNERSQEAETSKGSHRSKTDTQTNIHTEEETMKNRTLQKIDTIKSNLIKKTETTYK